MNLIRLCIAAVLVGSAFSASAEVYTTGEFIDSIQHLKSFSDSGVKSSKPLSEQDGKAIFFLEGSWQAWSSMADYDAVNPKDRVSDNIRLLQAKIPREMKGVTTDLLKFYADYVHLREQPAEEFLQAFFLSTYGADAAARDRSKITLGVMLLRSLYMYVRDAADAPAFAAWFQRCQDVVKRGRNTGLSEMDRDHYEICQDNVDDFAKQNAKPGKDAGTRPPPIAVKVGKVEVEITPPTGFVRIGRPQAAPLPPDTDGRQVLLVLGTPEDAALIAAGKPPIMQRTITVQRITFIPEAMQPSDFGELSERTMELVGQFEENPAVIRLNMLAKALDTPAALENWVFRGDPAMSSVDLGCFDHDKRSVCQTEIFKEEAVAGVPAAVVVRSKAMIHFRNAVFFIHVNANYNRHSELQWTQDTVKAMRDAVLENH